MRSPGHVDIPRPLALAIGLGASVLFAWLHHSAAGEGIALPVARHVEMSVRHWLGRDPVLDPRIRVYALGDTSVEELEEADLDLADWRRILVTLAAARPRAVLVDKVFGAPRGRASAPAFVETLRSFRFPVIAGAFVAAAPLRGRALMTAPDITSLFDRTADPARELARLDWLSLENGYPYGPSPLVRDGFRRIGHLMYAGNLSVKPLLRLSRRDALPAAALFTADEVRIAGGELFADGTRVPLDARGRTVLNLFPPSTLYDRTFALSGLLRKAREGKGVVLPPDAVVILLPSLYTGATDLQPSPFGMMPGGFFEAAFVNSLLTGNWIRVLGHGWAFVVLAGLLPLAALLFLSEGHFLAALFAVPAVVALAGQWAFSWRGLETPWLPSSLCYAASAGSLWLVNLALARRHFLLRGEAERDFSQVLDVVPAADGEVRFGRYHVVGLLGKGGMGEVFRAKTYGASGFEKEFAIKRILKGSWADATGGLERFEEEARLTSILTHPNIVQVYEFFRVKDTYLMVMELVEGRSLADVLAALRERGDQVPLPLAVRIASEMLAGLAYAHGKRDSSGASLGIVHRDVSPQNVMLSLEGEVKLIDFGLAKRAPNGVTLPGTIKGKLAYLSPEQARGGPIDHRSDLFSTALVLYEMITGIRPFEAESDLATLERARACAIPRAAALAPDVPEAIDETLAKALAKRPEDRFQSAIALRDALDTALRASRLAVLPGALGGLMGSLTGAGDRLPSAPSLSRSTRPASRDSAGSPEHGSSRRPRKDRRRRA